MRYTEGQRASEATERKEGRTNERVRGVFAMINKEIRRAGAIFGKTTISGGQGHCQTKGRARLPSHVTSSIEPSDARHRGTHRDLRKTFSISSCTGES